MWLQGVTVQGNPTGRFVRAKGNSTRFANPGAARWPIDDTQERWSACEQYPGSLRGASAARGGERSKPRRAKTAGHQERRAAARVVGAVQGDAAHDGTECAETEPYIAISHAAMFRHKSSPRCLF